MTPLLQKFLAGLSLAGLPESKLKSLLDSCRSAMLSVPQFQKQIQKVQSEIAATGPDHAAYNSAEPMPAADFIARAELSIASAEKREKIRTSKSTMIISPHSKMFSKPTAPPAPAAKPAASKPAPAQVRPTPAPTAAKPNENAPRKGEPQLPPLTQEQKIGIAIVEETERRRKAALVKTRAELEKMTPQEIGKFFKSGGKLTN